MNSIESFKKTRKIFKKYSRKHQESYCYCSRKSTYYVVIINNGIKWVNLFLLQLISFMYDLIYTMHPGKYKAHVTKKLMSNYILIIRDSNDQRHQRVSSSKKESKKSWKLRRKHWYSALGGIISSIDAMRNSVDQDRKSVV